MHEAKACLIFLATVNSGRMGEWANGRYEPLAGRARVLARRKQVCIAGITQNSIWSMLGFENSGSRGSDVAKAGRKETRKRRLCRIRRLPDDPSLVLGWEPHQTTPILTARSSIFGNFFWRQKNFAAASPLNLRDVNRCFHRSNPRLQSFTFGNLQYRPSWICKFVSKKDVTGTTIRPRKFKKNRKTPVCTVV